MMIILINVIKTQLLPTLPQYKYSQQKDAEKLLNATLITLSAFQKVLRHFTFQNITIFLKSILLLDDLNIAKQKKFECSDYKFRKISQKLQMLGVLGTDSTKKSTFSRIQTFFYYKFFTCQLFKNARKFANIIITIKQRFLYATQFNQLKTGTNYLFQTVNSYLIPVERTIWYKSFQFKLVSFHQERQKLGSNSFRCKFTRKLERGPFCMVETKSVRTSFIATERNQHFDLTYVQSYFR
eukprot:TRINITY_DN23953_c0_g1_i1.p2 TRINITY_DN23953_c0_g1~~TRINITY_DN23953_c0_g1_i1.p2  ORF type:complete len:239 (-),score=-14.82 TRINITY_DN23953_c0_g1_i1:27-743(-)